MTLKNPKRSGGPKSSEGRLVASQNSIKTGTYSNLAVLPDEDQAEFNQLVVQFNYDFHPADMIETSLVRELAVLTWKKLRLEKLEQGYLIKKLNSPITIDEFTDSGLRFNAERYEFWGRLVSLDELEVRTYTEVLDLIKPNIRTGVNVDLLLKVKLLNPTIYDSLLDFYRQLNPLASLDISDEVLVSETVCYRNQPERFLSSIIFERFVEIFEAGLWCTKKHHEIDQAVAQIKQERLLNMMQSDGVRRASDDLSRSMIRVLGEFRKHNEWRMKNRLIEAEEE